MSHVTHPTSPRLSLSLLPWAALALATTAVAVILILAITSGSDTRDTTIEPATAAANAPGVRYDGGPEEGSRGPSSQSSVKPADPGVRYDGGPEEGSRGPLVSP